jgi:hypothetical protein
MGISRTNGFAENRSNIKKIIYIAPQARAFKDAGFDNLDLSKTDALQKNLLDELNSLAKNGSNKIEVISIDPNSDISQDVFQSLIPLRNELLLHIQMQDNPLNKGRSDYGQAISKQVFVIPAKIAPEWSRLSKKFGTPYFGFVGAFSGPGKSLVINYVVDVNKGELIYQSISGKVGKLNNSTLSHLVFDSVLMMNKSK